MASGGGTFRCFASVAGGVLLGVALSEVGLRLYFHEHEANRNYWGRGAFVADDVLPYRHAASVTAVAGREGSFGPHHITTNGLGFRDHRIPTSAKEAPPGIVVAGASFVFGLGIEDYQDLFHVQLERRLRERDDCPKELQVFNVSQTGFKLNEICTLVEQEVDRFSPFLVILVLHQDDRVRFRHTRPDVVDGYRLEQGRCLAGTWVDHLRTHSYLWMRRPTPASVLSGTELGRVIAYLRHQGAPSRTMTGDALTGDSSVCKLLTGLRNRLAVRDIDLMCVVIYPADHPSSDFGQTLRAEGLPVIDMHPEPGWCLPREGHWNAYGYAKAAAFVARRVPLSRPEAG